MLFKLTWMWPMRMLAYVFNCIWSLRVFDEAAKVQSKKPNATISQSYDRMLRFLADYICQFLLLMFFSVEANAWSFLPYAIDGRTKTSRCNPESRVSSFSGTTSLALEPR
eukprot:GGOE01003310.1.p3 GENE.GGOE01003310.1~~GGOE01003310.1.p3  ORF type:complete len:110 (+),score=6.25 GGOE01003310.1:590-919(+)